MNEYTALTLILVVTFFAATVSDYYKRQSEAACFAVADTRAKLAICKGLPYTKEDQ